MRDHRAIFGRQIRGNGDRRANQMQAAVQSPDTPIASRPSLPAVSDLADFDHDLSGNTQMPIERARRASRAAPRRDRVSPLARPLGILAAGLTIAGASLGLAAVPASAGATAPASSGSGLTPGSYTGPGPQGGDGYYDVTFYVSSTGTKIQNISFPSIQVTCAPGGATPSFPIAIDSANLNANGSFSVSQSQKGDYAGYPATFKIAMSGQASGAGAGGQPTMTGTLSETVSYSNGTKYSCPTGTLSWSATRDVNQTLTTGAPPIGSYTGAGPQGGDGYYNWTYDVSSTQTALQNVEFPAITLTCSPGDATPAFEVVLDSVPLASDGSFTTSQTQTGDYDGYPATFKIGFSGNFHGLNANGAARAAGDLTETMTYTAGGTNYSCASNNLAIAAAYDASQTVTTGKPPTGSYTGPGPQGGDGYYNWTSYVAGNGKSLQNIAFPAISVTCAPGASTPSFPIAIDSVKVKKGAFGTTETWNGVYNGNPATYGVTFAGNFHGLNSAGAARINGSLTATMSYKAGAGTFSCTSNKMAISATYDANQTVTNPPPPAGTYTGAGPQGGDGYYDFTFSVSSDQTTVENVAFPAITMDCAPGNGSVTAPISIPPSHSARMDRSARHRRRTGTVGSNPATFTTTFGGVFHGENAQGLARAAGSMVESVTYTASGTSYTCSSNPLSWYATA